MIRDPYAPIDHKPNAVHITDLFCVDCGHPLHEHKHFPRQMTRFVWIMLGGLTVIVLGALCWVLVATAPWGPK